MASVTKILPGQYVKISRHAERFWLSDCRRTDDGQWTGKVANVLIEAPYFYGQRIEFDEDEVTDVATVSEMEKRAETIGMKLP